MDLSNRLFQPKDTFSREKAQLYAYSYSYQFLLFIKFYRYNFFEKKLSLYIFIITYRDFVHSMADSLGSRPGTSDEYHDPYCEPCEESRGRNVKVECFCKNCNQYLCIECHTTHGSLRASRGHVIQTGDDMPKSMADKPPRYDTCDDHPKHLKDQFCCDHGALICSACCSSSHSKCDTKSVADACQYIQPNEVDKLCDVNKAYKAQLLKFLSTVDKHGEKLTEQKKAMLKDAQTAYDKILVEIKRSYQNIKTVIEAESNSQEATVSQTKQKIKAQMSQVDAEINFTNKVRGSPINVKTFLSLQESISNTRESAAAIESLKDSLNLTSLSFEPSKDIQKLISQPVSFGSINKSPINVDVNVSVPDIKFPMSVKVLTGAVGTTQGRSGPAAHHGAVGTNIQQGRPIPVTQQASLGQIKAAPVGIFNIKTKEDKSSCTITGIAITPSGHRLLVDMENKEVKLFSHDMRFLSSVTVPGDYLPWDITMVNDREAVVSVRDSLVFLEVTDRQLRVKHTINLSFYAFGITYSKDRLIVTDNTTIHALDLRGGELWSVGRPLFQDAQYVCSNSDGRWVAVTDFSKNTVTLLDVNNGVVITSTQLEDRVDIDVLGVSVDTADNIFVCDTPNIVVLSGDLKNEHVLCNMGDKRFQTIAYDDKKHQLIISHGCDQDSVSCLQLS